jgi:2-polyprenyl-6-methoxyphenol hydroxylase-like FAD-dependent oxidoreductase
MDTVDTTCCIVGGGPAGMMLGFLLARAGVQATVIEKHGDFFRDFRGDTVHPSTLDLMHELGLLEKFLQIPHQELTSVGGVIGDYVFQAADFRHLPTYCKFVALMPQWDFLNFLAAEGGKFPGFRLLMQHEAVGLIRDGTRITGVEMRTPNGPRRINARLVVGCDGRNSTIRMAAGLKVREYGVPIDVLWFRISRQSNDPDQLLGNVNFGRVLVLINRSGYFQAGLIIRKGSFEEMKSRGLSSLRALLVKIAPYLGNRVEELQDWDQIKLLSVRIDRLDQWWLPGLLCIGDSAHAMSPAGGVGINLAIQDAVASANILAAPLKEGTVTEEHLAGVQKRREFPTRVIQTMQLNVHKLFERVFRTTGPMKAPWQLKVLTHIPGLRRLTARLVGIGARPEHINTR